MSAKRLESANIDDMATDPDVVAVSFRLARELTDAEADRLYDCAKDMLDAELVLSCTVGIVLLNLELPIDGGDPYDVALRAIRALPAFGATVIDVDDDLVDLSELGERSGVSHEAARKWSKLPDFPAPATVLSGGARLWEWGAVDGWLRRNKPAHAEQVVHLSRLERARLIVEIHAEGEPATKLALSSLIVRRPYDVIAAHCAWLGQSGFIAGHDTAAFVHRFANFLDRTRDEKTADA